MSLRVGYWPLCTVFSLPLFQLSDLEWGFGGKGRRIWACLPDSQPYLEPLSLLPCPRHSRASLQVLGTVGEPINPEAWLWYYQVVGAQRCPIVDTFWQTETVSKGSRRLGLRDNMGRLTQTPDLSLLQGGHMLTPLPGATPMKPGSAVSEAPLLVLG